MKINSGFLNIQDTTDFPGGLPLQAIAFTRSEVWRIFSLLDRMNKFTCRIERDVAQEGQRA